MKHTYSVEPPKIEIDGQVYQLSKPEYLAYVGAMIPVIIDNTPILKEIYEERGIQIQPYHGNALLDTGSSLCVIPDTLAQTLRLNREIDSEVSFVQGGAKLPTYAGIIKFEWGGEYYVPIAGSTTVDYVIIGRDILSKWDVRYNGREGIITIDDNNSTSFPEMVNLFGQWIIRHFKSFHLFRTGNRPAK